MNLYLPMHKKYLTYLPYLSFVNCGPVQLHKLLQQKSSNEIAIIVLSFCRRLLKMTATLISTPISHLLCDEQPDKAGEVSQILESVSGSKMEHQMEIVSRKIDQPKLNLEPNKIARENCIVKQINGPTFVEDICLCSNICEGRLEPM